MTIVAETRNVVHPEVSNPKFVYILARKRKVAKDTYELMFRPENRRLQFSPGQYIRMTIPLAHHDPRGNGRDFSVASSPDDEYLRITTRNTGSGFKRTLLEEKGIRADINGPFGLFTLPKKYNRPLVFIAGGIGITPFHSIITCVKEKKLPFKITLIYVNSNRGNTAYLEFLRRCDREDVNFSLKLHFGRLNSGTLQQDTVSISDPLYYIAGSPDMVMHTRKLLYSLGVSERSIKAEEFTGYREEFTDRRMNGDNNLAKRILTGETKKLGEGMEGELAHRSMSDLEALLQALNNTAIVSETNASGSITFVNDKFIEISKYSRDELIGQNHRILKSGYHTKAFYENMWATISRGTLWRGQIKNKAKDGSYYWVDTSIAPILSDGTPVKYISVRFPITERQLAEEQLQERAKQQHVLTVLSQEALASTDLSVLADTAASPLGAVNNDR